MSDLIENIRFRPTGYWRPNQPPDVLLETDESEQIGTFEHAEEHEARLALVVRFLVPHRDALRDCQLRAREQLVALLLRDYYDEAVKLTRLLYNLEQELHTGDHLMDGELRKAASALHDQIYHLAGMLNPANNVR